VFNEARACMNIRHGNVVDVYDLGEDDGRWFVAMEYVPGLSFRQIQDRAREAQVRLPRSVVVDLLIGVCRGLGAAHLATDGEGRPLQLVHRDVKPSNLMVDRSGTVRVLDFGIVWASTNVTRTATGVMKGTPSYMAPEQWAGRVYGPPTDLFSLGAVGFELACGRRLFRGRNVAELFHQVQHASPDELALVEARFPAFAPVLRRCLARDPDDRWPTAAALEAELLALRAELPPGGDLQTFMRLLTQESDEGWQPPDIDDPDWDTLLQNYRDARSSGAWSPIDYSMDIDSEEVTAVGSGVTDDRTVPGVRVRPAPTESSAPRRPLVAAFLGAAVLGAVGWMLWPAGPQVPQEPTVDETPADGSASDGEEPRPDTPEAPGPTEAATPQEAASPTEVLIAEDPTPPPGAPEATPAEPAPSEPTPQADVVLAGDPWEVDETPAPVAEPPPLAVARIRHDPAADLPARIFVPGVAWVRARIEDPPTPCTAVLAWAPVGGRSFQTVAMKEGPAGEWTGRFALQGTEGTPGFDYHVACRTPAGDVVGRLGSASEPLRALSR